MRAGKRGGVASRWGLGDLGRSVLKTARAAILDIAPAPSARAVKPSFSAPIDIVNAAAFRRMTLAG